MVSWWLSAISRNGKRVTDKPTGVSHTYLGELCFGERARDKGMECTQAQNESVTLKKKIPMLYGLEGLEGLYSFGN